MSLKDAYNAYLVDCYLTPPFFVDILSNKMGDLEASAQVYSFVQKNYKK